MLLRKKAKNLVLVKEFLDNFIKWIDSKGQNNQLYDWLVTKSESVQSTLGRIGIIAFRAPFGLYTSNNYPVILNAIPEIQKEFWDTWRSDSDIVHYAQIVDNVLRRYIGVAEEQLKEETKKFFNPIILFCNGVAWILESPFYIFTECKIISHRRFSMIVNGRIFSFISGLTALVTLVSSIMAIVIGWNKFKEIVSILWH